MAAAPRRKAFSPANIGMAGQNKAMLARPTTRRCLMIGPSSILPGRNDLACGSGLGSRPEPVAREFEAPEPEPGVGGHRDGMGGRQVERADADPAVLHRLD